jgi:hypothetical protein
MLAWLAIACAPTETDQPACPEWPSEESAIDGKLGNEDTCGLYSLAVDEQVVIELYLSEPIDEAQEEAGAAITACESTFSDGLDMRYDAGSYTNMSDDAPKFVMQVFGSEARSDPAEFDSICFEGTEFHARFRVSAAE